jgi:hypothetical protein
VNGEFSDFDDKVEKEVLIALRCVLMSHVEKSGQGPHIGGAAALSQGIFFH